MKKSMTSGLVVVYLLTAVIVSVIIIYGYTTITKFRGSMEVLSITKFQNEINEQIKSVYFSYGTERTRDFNFPSKYSEVCFIDNVKDWDSLILPTDIDPIISVNIRDKIQKNVFLIEDTATNSFWTDEKISVVDDGKDILCVTPVNGKITLRFKGRGTHAIIESVN